MVKVKGLGFGALGVWCGDITQILMEKQVGNHMEVKMKAGYRYVYIYRGGYRIVQELLLPNSENKDPMAIISTFSRRGLA